SGSRLRIRVACLTRQTDPTTRSTDSDPQPEDRRAPPNYRDRSPIRSIFVQVGQDFTEFHHRFSCRHFPSNRERWLDPSLANGIEQKRIRNQWAPARRRWTKLGYDAIAVRDQHGFASSRQPDVFAELVFEQFDPD